VLIEARGLDAILRGASGNDVITVAVDAEADRVCIACGGGQYQFDRWNRSGPSSYPRLQEVWDAPIGTVVVAAGSDVKAAVSAGMAVDRGSITLALTGDGTIKFSTGGQGKLKDAEAIVDCTRSGGQDVNVPTTVCLNTEHFMNWLKQAPGGDVRLSISADGHWVRIVDEDAPASTYFMGATKPG
jgi:hypothetical protein